MKKAHFVLSKEVVLEKYKEVEDLADLVSYSSKTNPLVTKILEENTKSQFSVHIENELINIKDKSRVLFLAQGWNQERIDALVKDNVTRFVLDNESDLNELLKYLKTSEAKVEVFLRAKLKENTLRTERHFVFGMNVDLVNKKISEIKGNKNILALGIHVHRKTQNMAEWNLAYEISNMFTPETLDAISYLNIGGGLPSEYANTNIKVFQSIYRKINELKDFLHNKNIKLIIEPGRYISAPSVKLISYITGMYDNNIIVNVSIYNSDMDAVIVPVKLLIENELKKGEGNPYVVKGMTPCSIDLFRYRVYLEEKNVGDKIIFLNAGAYNFSSDFCDLEKPKTIIVDSFDDYKED